MVGADVTNNREDVLEFIPMDRCFYLYVGTAIPPVERISDIPRNWEIEVDGSFPGRWVYFGAFPKRVGV